MPKVSIIIGSYNAEKYIEETVLSVLNQTYKDFELIVVDDGSKDKTPKIVEKLIKFPHKLIVKKNGGEASARNAGLQVAQGKYISFLDHDDLLVPNKLKKQVEFLDNYNEFGMVYSNYNFIIDTEVQQYWKNWNFNIDNNGCGDIFVKQFIENKIHIITAMIRKDCFDTVGYFDESINYACDSDMWIRISALYKIGYLQECMAYYRMHHSNVSLDREICLLHRLSSLKKNYLNFKNRLDGTIKFRKIIAPLYYRLISIYFKKGNFKSILFFLSEYLCDYF